MCVAVNVAIALLLIFRRKDMQESIRTCVCCFEVCFFEYGLYMCCVACMIVACVYPAKCAIALLLISKSKKMQESIRTCVLTMCDVSNMNCICFV